MFSMFLYVCKNLINYIRKLWISRGGPIEIRGGIVSISKTVQICMCKVMCVYDLDFNILTLSSIWKNDLNDLIGGIPIITQSRMC